MTNEQSDNPPTPREIESHHFDLTSVEREFEEALEYALHEIKAGRAKRARYDFRDGIEDAAHLEHITIEANDGTILYDQDFDLENATLRQTDPSDN